MSSIGCFRSLSTGSKNEPSGQDYGGLCLLFLSYLFVTRDALQTSGWPNCRDPSQVFLPREAVGVTEFVAAKYSEFNVVIPGATDEDDIVCFRQSGGFPINK
jgi:hypothetical protein